MKANSNGKARTRKAASLKPKKPYKDFPLTPHASGSWQKKIRGQVYYFGRWGRVRNGKMERLPDDGWKEALELYKAQADDLHAGRKPRLGKSEDLTIKDLCNRFLTAKHRKLEASELSIRTYMEYRQTTDRLMGFFDKNRLVDDVDTDDFEELRAEIATTCGPTRLGNEITRVKSVFKYAADNKLIEHAVTFGTEFRKPSKAVMRKHKAKSDKKLFAVQEIQSLLNRASPLMKAAILLGINCGAGNSDVSNLEFKHLDLDAGWLNYPRGKTGIARRVPLWDETIAALRAAIEARPKPKKKEDEEIVLLTTHRERLVRVTEKSRTDSVTTGFGKLLRKLKINGRKGLGFYSLRHTFATIGLQTGDRDAVKALMGHAEGDVLAVYDETGPADERLLAVSNHVHAWLFDSEDEGGEQ